MSVYDIHGNRIDSAASSGARYSFYSPDVAKSGLIISHRCQPYPENTIEGANLKRKDGFSIMEIDVSFTRDGVPVACHSGEINSHARNLDGSAISGTVYIESLTYEQTQNYDFGIYKGEQYAGIKCPTIREFCQFFRRWNIPFMVDLSMGGSALTAAQSDILHDIFEDTRTIPLAGYSCTLADARTDVARHNDVAYNILETQTLEQLNTVASEFVGRCAAAIASMNTTTTAETITEARKLGLLTAASWYSTVESASAAFDKGHDFLWSDNLTSSSFEEAST